MDRRFGGVACDVAARASSFGSGASPELARQIRSLGTHSRSCAQFARLHDDGSAAVDSEQATTVNRIYAAGNCADPRALVPAATGSGVTAAVAINVRLSFEDASHAVADSAAPAPASDVP